MPQKNLIIIFLSLFAASAVFLFWQNEQELDPNQGKNWWTLSFATLEKNDSLDFIVQNYSDTTLFEYEITTNLEEVFKNSFELKRGEMKKISAPLMATSDARTTVTVTADKEKKEIYRETGHKNDESPAVARLSVDRRASGAV